MQQVEELKRLATRPDDSWMDSMSNEELQALGKRVRKVADGLSGLQSKLVSGTPAPVRRPPTTAPSSGSLGSIVRRDTAATSGGASQWKPPAPAKPAQSPFPGQSGAMDLGSPMRRRVGGAAPSAPMEAPRPAASKPAPNPYNPFSKPEAPPSSGKRGRPQL